MIQSKIHKQIYLKKVFYLIGFANKKYYNYLEIVLFLYSD